MNVVNVNYVCILTAVIEILFYNMIKSSRFVIFLSYIICRITLGKIKELFLRSLKEHPEILEKMEREESDEKTKALVRMLLNEIHNDPEYSGVNH